MERHLRSYAAYLFFIGCLIVVAVVLLLGLWGWLTIPALLLVGLTVALSLASGYGLLKRTPWAWVTGLVATAVVSIVLAWVNPVGILTGLLTLIYGYWVLLHPSTRQILAGGTPAAAGQLKNVPTEE